MFMLVLSDPTVPCEVVNGNINISEVLIRDDDGKESSYELVLFCHTDQQEQYCHLIN